MRISVQCQCGKSLAVSQFQAGKTIPCPACKAIVPIPASEEVRVTVPPPLKKTAEEIMVARVQTAIEQENSKEGKSIGKNLITLGVSIFLFISLGLFRNSISGIVLLVGVIFIHEMGHFIGMKLLKYKDVQMFFIPLFGAAVSGKETAPSAAKKAIVSLLGPVPGILIGIGTGIAYFVTKQPILADATRTFLFLNTFNLLPFLPLDGGRMFDALIFSRHPKIEIAFKTLTAILLAWIAIKFKDIFFGLFAFSIFITLGATKTSATIAHMIKKEMDDSDDCASHDVPKEYLHKIIWLLKRKLPPKQWNPQIVAPLTSGIWQRIRNKPCGIAPTIGLVFAYIFFFLLGASSAFIFEVTASTLENRKIQIVNEKLLTGKDAQFQIITVEALPISKTQINSNGLFHGSHQSWRTFSGLKRSQGQWKDGYPHGEWLFWDFAETFSEIIEYDMGNPIKYHMLVDGIMQEVPPNEWPRSKKLKKETEPQGREDLKKQ